MPVWVSLAVAVVIYVVLMVFLGLNDQMCASYIPGDLNRLVNKAFLLCWVG